MFEISNNLFASLTNIVAVMLTVKLVEFNFTWILLTVTIPYIQVCQIFVNKGQDLRYLEVSQLNYFLEKIISFHNLIGYIIGYI